MTFGLFDNKNQYTVYTLRLSKCLHKQQHTQLTDVHVHVTLNTMFHHPHLSTIGKLPILKYYNYHQPTGPKPQKTR